ncbi:MAG TPA: ATP synthase F1 subunit delta [Gaiellaceae bacterium]|nr:ATP synthase F1 subunit delta [Gaiellaceae bacterium]
MYARALFEAAQREGKLDLVHTQVRELAEAATSVDELRLLLENPEVDSRVKEDVLARVASGADELVVNVAKLLAEKGRAGEIADVAAELDVLVAMEHRVLDVELTTAKELSDEEFGRILGRIEQASGRKVQAERKVDESLIGGIVLQAGSMRLDASVRGRLERLRHELTHARS